MKPKIFLSYAWANSSIADEIDNHFQAININLTRDIRDLEYRSNLKEFMETLGKHDFVLTIISDEYLRSENCMYEGLELLLTHEMKERILPILLDNAKELFIPFKRAAYYDYWENKLQEAIAYRKKYTTHDAVELVRKYSSIYNYLDIFLSNITDLKVMYFSEIVSDNYRKLLNIIGHQDKEIESEVQDILGIQDKDARKEASEAFVLRNASYNYIEFYRGLFSENLENYSAAKKHYENFLSTSIYGVSELHAKAYIKLSSLVEYNLSDSDEAMEILEKGVVRCKESVELLCHYGVFLIQISQNREKAKRQFLDALKLDSRNVQTLNLLAIVCEQTNNFSEAKKYYEAIIEIDSNDKESAAAYENIGLINWNYFSDYLSARKCFEKAIELEPLLSGSYRQLGELLENHFNDYDNAKKVYEKAIELMPEDGLCYIGLALLQQSKMNDYKAARYNLEQAIKVNYETYEPYFFLGALLKNHFYDYENAIKNFEEAVKIEPEFYQAHLFLGKIYEDNCREYVKARHHYEATIRFNPNSAEGHYYLSKLLRDKFNEKDKANEHYIMAARLNPNI